MTTKPTLTSFVNRWECDENDHLNVQFFFSRFEEADRQFQLKTGLSEALVGSRRVRHVRYHREFKLGDLITVYSSVAFDGPHLLTVVHEMFNAGTCELAATAVDGYEPNSSAVKTLRQRFKDFQRPMIDEAAPRGLAITPTSQRISLDTVLAKGADVCYRSTVLPRHIGADGRADDCYALCCCTDGVVHVWQRTPMNYAYMKENGLGRVAVEMKLSWASPAKIGDSIVIATGFTGVQSKTFTLRHHLFESRTKRLLGTLDVVALMMDLETRKAVPIPEEAAKFISRSLLN